MSAGISPGKYRPKFLAVDSADHSIASGAAGWIDTDLSSELPAGALAAVIVVKLEAGATDGGVRENGSTATSRLNIALISYTAIVKLNAARHVDLYRNAGGNMTYVLVGYLV
jgi:hypothetical protein